MEREIYYIHDWESGWPIEVTKEQWEAHKAIREHFRIKMGLHHVSKPIIFGTAGDMEASQDLKQIFYNPEHFNQDDNRNQWEETTRQGYFIPAYTKTDVSG